MPQDCETWMSNKLVLATPGRNQEEGKMSKISKCIFAAVAATCIGLGGTSRASAVPMNGNLLEASIPAPELQKVYYRRYARRYYRRAYRRGYGTYYGGYYPGYSSGYYGSYYPGYSSNYYYGGYRRYGYRRYW
jgi:hypothetical protein